MFRVDVGRILNEHFNPCGGGIRNPDPLGQYDHQFGLDDFESDEFRMFSFKIKKCPINRTHDWTVCPYAHRGERARRRDPRRHPYVALACPDFRATGGVCPRGELCEYAHGVFEYWLHPAKYRTRACTAGGYCTRPVCFFAHSPKELRSEPIPHLPKWARLAIRAEADARARGLPYNVTNNGGGGGELGVIGRPNPVVPTGSNSGISSSNNLANGYPNLNLELLERLRRLEINDYYNSQVGKNQNMMNHNNSVDLDAPNFDWVSDLLAGDEFQ